MILCVELLLLPAGITKGAGKPNEDQVGTVTAAQVMVSFVLVRPRSVVQACDSQCETVLAQ